jgi:hypothetical protein
MGSLKVKRAHTAAVTCWTELTKSLGMSLELPFGGLMIGLFPSSGSSILVGSPLTSVQLVF